MTDPLRYLHEAAVHQLRESADAIENGEGLVRNFDYDEELLGDTMQVGQMEIETFSSREVTMEITYLLPE